MYENKTIPQSDSYYKKIYYDRQGTKNSKAICFYLLHGMGGDSSAWKDIRSLLSQKGYGSVAIDLRGHGWSNRPKEISEYALVKLADDVVDIIKHENDQKIVLVGHCLGGMVALNIANMYPKLSGLVLINSYYTYPRYAGMVAKIPFLTNIFYVFGKLFPIVYDRQRPNYHEFRGSADISISRIISDIKHTSLKSYCFLLFQVLRVNYKHLLKKITMPVLILTGTDDSIFTLNNQREMTAHISNAITQDIKHGNHVMVFDRGMEIVGLIEEFIKKLNK